MQLLNATEAPQLVNSSMLYITLDNTAIEDAKEKFWLLKEAGVIKQISNFEDKVWYTTDEYSNVGLHFKLNKFGYQNYKEIFNMDFDDFTNALKAYMVSLFGRNVLQSIRSFLLDIRHILSVPPSDIYGTMADLTIATPAICSDFFTSLKNVNEEEVTRLTSAMEAFTDYNLSSSKSALAQRELADFDTYFRFDDIMTDFWNTETDSDTRLFYFPLYLWWKLTAVIPLRPREFLLTRRNCLKRTSKTVVEGNLHYNYKLTLRRNKLKGGRKNVTYRIDEDYFEDTYPVPDYLGELIESYLKATDSFKATSLDTLFVTTPHYNKWEISSPVDSRFLTYTNLCTILRYFYNEIVVGKYGYRVTEGHPGQHLENKEISTIHLGDTRHLALINLMQEGGTPAVAMFLAGHTNTVMAASYYSNIKKLIECKTYRMYRRMLSDGNRYKIAPIPIAVDTDETYVELADKSKCYSSNFRKGNFCDCYSARGDVGENGYCNACKYHRNKGFAYFDSDEIYKQRIESDLNELARAIEIVRKDRGHISEIGEALYKLQSSSFSFQQFLMNKYINEEKNIS